MNFQIPEKEKSALARFELFLQKNLKPHVNSWRRAGAVPRDFFNVLGEGGWFGFQMNGDRLEKDSPLRSALLMERMAALSPGVAITHLVQVDLGMTGLWLYGSDRLQNLYGGTACSGHTLICLGNTERHAGSDAAAISMTAEPVDGGWRLNGAKSYVTNGHISDLAVVTAVTDPGAPRNRRISMFLVDLTGTGVSRQKLKKPVWAPSDLTRIRLEPLQ